VDENVGIRPYARPLSNILSGKLYLDSVGGASRDLRAGEHLAVADASGLLNILSPGERQLDIRFTGRVGGLDIGAGESRRSIMPTWFEWLTANHGLSALWAAGLYSFGLVLAVYRWWTGPS
jgi:hypothetical protein